MKRVLLIVGLTLLVLLILVSLALNGVIIFGLLQARQATLTTVADARDIIRDVGDGEIAYAIELDQEIPLAIRVPVDKDVVVPIETTIPISTVVVVPVDPPLLPQFDIPVPIQTVIPIDLEVVVPISETVDVATSVPLDLDVPIEIPLADTPLGDCLEDLDEALARMEERLANPLGGEGQ